MNNDDTFDFECSEYSTGKRFDLMDYNRWTCRNFITIVIVISIQFSIQYCLAVALMFVLGENGLFVAILILFVVYIYCAVYMRHLIAHPFSTKTGYSIIIIKEESEMIKNKLYLINEYQSEPIAILYNVTSNDIDFREKPRYRLQFTFHITICDIMLNEQDTDWISTVAFMKQVSKYLGDENGKVIIQKKLKRHHCSCNDMKIICKYCFGSIEGKQLQQYVKLSNNSCLSLIFGF
eukprot:489921_1